MRARLALLAVTLSVLAAATPAAASVEVPFTPRFSANAHGDVAIAANTLMTCPDGGGVETACLEARGGVSAPSLNNNGYKMGTVDVDSDATTFDSSQATLSLPPGASVLFAGLYYGARTSAGEEGAAAADPAARGTVLLQAPGAASYSSLAAEVDDSTAIKGSYVGFVDVTPIVAAAGAGDYRVADVQAGTGKDRYAGWSLLVAYGDPAAPPAACASTTAWRRSRRARNRCRSGSPGSRRRARARSRPGSGWSTTRAIGAQPGTGCRSPANHCSTRPTPKKTSSTARSPSAASPRARSSPTTSTSSASTPT